MGNRRYFGKGLALTFAAAGIAVVAISGTAVADMVDGAGYGYHGGWHGGWGWGGMIFGPLFMILLLVLVIAGAALLLRWLGGAPSAGSGATSSNALHILEERFARGEIDKDEFEEKRRLLSR